MKKLSLILACCIVTMFNTAYSQLSKEKKYEFLRAYKAPDFKQKRFDIALDLGGGSNALSTSTTGRFSEYTDFGYSQYSNSQKYQGLFRTYLNSRINWNKSDIDELFAASTGVGVSTINRFYFKPNWFVGVYGFASLRNWHRNETGFTNSNSLGFTVSPTIAIGKGRLEPIQYARNAMDIERQLNRGGRLSKPYSISELNRIADQLAIINNVRFYDFRLRRIEQFEAIDATLRDIGGVSEFDVAYFANLADAYLYAQNFQRFSGFRNEIGITSQARIHNALFVDEPSNSESYASNLYYNLSYNFAQSYAIQHTLFTNVLAGYYRIKSPGNGPNEGANGLLSAGYELGIYPTTRTNLNLGVKAGVDVVNVDYLTSVYANGSIYLSPQFRLAFEVNYSPDTHYFESVYVPFPSVDSREFDFVMGGSVSLRYAIF
ncbi:MAG: hypothetical protein GQ574_18665 [Crocinitomix sp.]|nr:hypothetical protein [Crocinitomix sp.]